MAQLRYQPACWATPMTKEAFRRECERRIGDLEDLARSRDVWGPESPDPTKAAEEAAGARRRAKEIRAKHLSR
jgi:hypothetical protein